MINFGVYESITTLSLHIGEYFHEVTGITPVKGKHYNCILPGHKETVPSMVFYDTHFWCFGCKKRIDIFTLASIFDKKPIHWYEGYTENNINHLLAKYGYIPQEQENAQDILASTIVPYAADYFKRELRPSLHFTTDEQAHEYGVGILDRPNELMAAIMETYAIPEEDIYSILNPVPFGTDKTTYLITDHMDRPVAFTFRNLSHGADLERAKAGENIVPRKYIWCGIFGKTVIPMGLSDIHLSRGLPIIIVESPKTKIFTKVCGVNNVLALCGSNFSKEVIERLLISGVKNLSFCLDNDKSGRDGTLAAIENMYKVGCWFDITVVDWPDNIPERYNIEDIALENSDDYAFDIVSNTIDIITFIYKYYGIDGYSTCVKYASLNSLEGLRSRTASQIAKVFTMSSSSVRADIERTRYEADKKRALTLVKEIEYEAQLQQKKLIVGATTPQEATTILTKHINKYNSRILQRRDYSQNNVVESISEIIQDNEKRDRSSKIGWNTGMWFFDKAMEGLPKSQSTIIFGASANVGKSAFVINLATNILLAEGNDDIHICFVSNDDSLRKTVPKFIARLSGLNSTWCKHPNMYVVTQEDKAMYKSAVHTLNGFIDRNNPKLSIYDVSTIQTETQCMDLVRHVQDTYGKKVLFVLDNFHNILLTPGQDSTQSREHLITLLHNSTISLDYTLILTAEIRKLNINSPKVAPVTEDLKDSIRLGYVPTIVGLLWSSWWAYGHPDGLENNRHDVLYYETEEGHKMPILECYIDKNKADMLNLDSNKIRLYYKSHPGCCKFEEISKDSVEIKHTKVMQNPYDSASENARPTKALQSFRKHQHG